MAMIPGTRQAQDAIYDWLRDDLTNIHWFIDRSDQEPLEEKDWPGCCLRMLNIVFEDAEGATQRRCTATVMFDFQSGGEAGLTIDAVNQNSMALTMRSLWQAMQDADSDVAKIFEELEPESVDSSEQSTPEAGWAVLTYQATFYILREDPFVLVRRP